VVEERPLREIISASSKLSPVKKDLIFDKEELRLLKMGVRSNNGKIAVLGASNNISLTLNNVIKSS